MRLAIIARYRPPTDSRGSRHIVQWGDITATIPYDYAARNAGVAAILRALAEHPRMRDAAERAEVTADDLVFGYDGRSGAVVAVIRQP